MRNKLSILNRRGGLRPKGGRFFTLGRPVDAASVLKKNREKNEGKTRRHKKPVRIKKTAWWGGKTAKTQWDKKPYEGGAKRLAGGMGIAGWRYRTQRIYSITRLGALRHTR